MYPEVVDRLTEALTHEQASLARAHERYEAVERRAASHPGWDPILSAYERTTLRLQGDLLWGVIDHLCETDALPAVMTTPRTPGDTPQTTSLVDRSQATRWQEWEQGQWQTQGQDRALLRIAAAALQHTDTAQLEQAVTHMWRDLNERLQDKSTLSDAELAQTIAEERVLSGIGSDLKTEARDRADIINTIITRTTDRQPYPTFTEFKNQHPRTAGQLRNPDLTTALSTATEQVRDLVTKHVEMAQIIAAQRPAYASRSGSGRDPRQAIRQAIQVDQQPEGGDPPPKRRLTNRLGRTQGMAR